jgi:hypothetical protein
MLKATGTLGSLLTRVKLLSTWKRCSINLVQSTAGPTGWQTIHGEIAVLCDNSEITAFNSIVTTAMVHQAAQGRAAQEPASVRAAQDLAIRVRAIKEVITNNLVVEASNRITSPGIRVTQSSSVGVSITFSQLALTSENGKYANGRLT